MEREAVPRVSASCTAAATMSSMFRLRRGPRAGPGGGSHRSRTVRSGSGLLWLSSDMGPPSAVVRGEHTPQFAIRRTVPQPDNAVHRFTHVDARWLPRWLIVPDDVVDYELHGRFGLRGDLSADFSGKRISTPAVGDRPWLCRVHDDPDLAQRWLGHRYGHARCGERRNGVLFAGPVPAAKPLRGAHHEVRTHAPTALFGRGAG